VSNYTNVSGEDTRGRITLPEAAGMLHLPVESVVALVGAGYLHTTTSTDGPRFALGDLKAFLARNADGEPVVDLFDASLDELDPQTLLDALDGRSEDMARRTLDLLVTVFPQAGRWSLGQQARFIEDARARFEAILAVAALGDRTDQELIDDLGAVGADAAQSLTPLPEVLLVLRISRDLVVQTAVEVAEERGRHWGLALSLLLTRVLPALDRLTDAVARGYWAAVLDRQEESRARFANMVEHSTDGVYEVDVDGRLRYANAALGVILGRRTDEIIGERFIDVLDPATQFSLEAEESEVVIRRADGVVRVLDIRGIERRVNGVLVGYDGTMRDLTAALRFEELRNDLLALLGHELRQPLTTILGLGATLEAHGEEFEATSVEAIGEKIRQQSERIARLVDDLYEISRLEYDAQLVNRRHLDLAATVNDALAAVVDADQVEVAVPAGLIVLADRRRVEQVVANLVDNALRYGAAPVIVTADKTGDDLVVQVRDHGPGVDREMEPNLFSTLTLTGLPRRLHTTTGLGLALVRGLVEAMGGRVWYEPAPTGGAAFSFTLPTA
jgi:PAS domain S-box-containing protein